MGKKQSGIRQSAGQGARDKAKEGSRQAQGQAGFKKLQ